MEIGLVQYCPSWENKDENKKKITSLLNTFIKDEVNLLIFPEMTLTGFTMSAEKFSEKLSGESFNYFSNIAQKFKSNILAGIIEREDENFYNTLLHINKDGNIVKAYRKIHPFSISSEDKYYTKGKKPVVTKIDNWKVGLSICYDLRFPELYRQYCKEKVELIVVSANWSETRIEHWKTLLKARAIENQCYVAGVNRIGNDPKLVYPGFSAVIDPMGNEIISSINEEIIFCNINSKVVNDIRAKLPFLTDITLI
ncbi:MAG TPA: nitrilase-related carbon-nitrogen hydrolase [Ignavibacteriaceae bacterium]|nr:nitrilase-related carbon-nitrogen hydrolase [Ignavibacteriaceae bacterium]